MTSSKNIIIVLIALITLLLGAIVYTFLLMSKDSATVMPDQVNQPVGDQKFLVMDVPYEGQFGGTLLYSGEHFVVNAVHSVWQDDRKSLEEWIHDLPHESGVSGFSRIVDFLEDESYITIRVLFEPKNLDSLKMWLQNNNVPLYYTQKMHADANMYEQRALIGYDDKKQVFIVHSQYLGNNYEVPYNVFVRDFISDTLYSFIPDESLGFERLSVGEPYPERTALMDDPDVQELTFRWLELNHFERQLGNSVSDHGPELRKMWMEIIDSKGIYKLHPIARNQAAVTAARYFKWIDDYDTAIQILNDHSIANYPDHPYGEGFVSFDEPFAGWGREIEYVDFWYSAPSLILAEYYLRNGDPEPAPKLIANAKARFSLEHLRGVINEFGLNEVEKIF